MKKKRDRPAALNQSRPGSEQASHPFPFRCIRRHVVQPHETGSHRLSLHAPARSLPCAVEALAPQEATPCTNVRCASRGARQARQARLHPWLRSHTAHWLLAPLPVIGGTGAEAKPTVQRRTSTKVVACPPTFRPAGRLQSSRFRETTKVAKHQAGSFAL